MISKSFDIGNLQSQNNTVTMTQPIPASIPAVGFTMEGAVDPQMGSWYPNSHVLNECFQFQPIEMAMPEQHNMMSDPFMVPNITGNNNHSGMFNNVPPSLALFQPNPEMPMPVTERAGHAIGPYVFASQPAVFSFHNPVANSQTPWNSRQEYSQLPAPSVYDSQNQHNYIPPPQNQSFPIHTSQPLRNFDIQSQNSIGPAFYPMNPSSRPGYHPQPSSLEMRNNSFSSGSPRYPPLYNNQNIPNSSSQAMMPVGHIVGTVPLAGRNASTNNLQWNVSNNTMLHGSPSLPSSQAMDSQILAPPGQGPTIGTTSTDSFDSEVAQLLRQVRATEELQRVQQLAHEQPSEEIRRILEMGSTAPKGRKEGESYKAPRRGRRPKTYELRPYPGGICIGDIPNNHNQTEKGSPGTGSSSQSGNVEREYHQAGTNITLDPTPSPPKRKYYLKNNKVYYKDYWEDDDAPIDPHMRMFKLIYGN